MSVRHTPRQSERDIRLHDPHTPHGHPHPIPLPPPPGHSIAHGGPPPPPPHLNGNGHPQTPLSSGHAVLPQGSAPMATSPANSNGVVVPTAIQKLAQANEQTWLLIGRVAEQMGNLEHALSAYENALRHNPMSLSGLTQVAGIARIKENYPKAVDYFQRVLNMQQDNGEVWSALGHCYLMQDDLQKAYAAYQQALYLLPNPKEDPKLWYGIGILYDRYGSLDHAEEAFASVLRMDKVVLDFDKANEILFRLGIIYKQQSKYDESLQCFDRILRNPPNPLAHADIWFQIGHVYEQQRDHTRARDAYERVVRENPGHAKVLQQLGWLYHQDGSSFQNQDLAIQYLTKSLEADPSDAQSWYLLGRAYMAGQKYNKAYEAYQQAVYRDGRNPTFWCSIGVLYFQINQYRDALDAYSRAIRINPYISEVWFDLGSLYESCNNQISDAIDAYARASELDPANTAISQRLTLLKNAQATGSTLPAAPGPQDVHPTAYANPTVIPPPPGLTGPPMLLQSTNGRPIFRTESRGPPDGLPMSNQPPPLGAGRSSPGPFRGGPPPPVILDDNQHSSALPLLRPIDDRPPHLRDGPYPQEGNQRGGPHGLLLHHPTPVQQLPGEPGRGQPPHPHEFQRIRVPSRSASPPPPHSARPRSTAGYMQQPQFEGRPHMGPGQGMMQPRSPPPGHHPRDIPGDREPGWDRRPGPADHREFERRGRPGPAPGPEFQSHPQQYYAGRHSPPPPYPPRAHSPRAPRDSPTEASPRGYQRPYWDKPAGPPGPGSMVARSPRRPSLADIPPEPSRERYDPRRDAREPQPSQYEQRDHPMFAHNSPEVIRRSQLPPPPYPMGNGQRMSDSPHMSQGAPAAEPSRGRGRKGKEQSPAPPPPSNASVPPAEAPKKKRRTNQKRPLDPPTTTTRFEAGYGAAPPLQQVPSFKVDHRPSKPSSHGSPEPVSSNGSGSGSVSRSVQPSPTNSVNVVPNRDIDEDYDEGVTMLMELQSGSRSGAPASRNGVSQSPQVAHVGRTQSSSQVPQHSTGRYPAMMSRTSPPMGTKRPLSPGPHDQQHVEMKRSRVGSVHRRASSPSASGPHPPSSRPSPIPFRQQPTSHSPETRQPPMDNGRSYPPSPALPTMLPPHPRPIGAGLSGHGPLPSMHARSSSSPGEDDRTSPRERHGKIVLSPPTQTPVGGGGGPHAKGTPSPSSSHASHHSNGGREKMMR
ncbi:TPR-like protein [Cristinia sonorae]|uniref:TPR-like protein n=1 Tax=Cristinia sonorae TaxID=1940300 RepID=A0A8K0UQX1_9AGAR|nr:TPR-like protein [Cristinia sonorae]